MGAGRVVRGCRTAEPAIEHAAPEHRNPCRRRRFRPDTDASSPRTTSRGTPWAGPRRLSPYPDGDSGRPHRPWSGRLRRTARLRGRTPTPDPAGDPPAHLLSRSRPESPSSLDDHEFPPGRFPSGRSTRHAGDGRPSRSARDSGPSRAVGEPRSTRRPGGPTPQFRRLKTTVPSTNGVYGRSRRTPPVASHRPPCDICNS